MILILFEVKKTRLFHRQLIKRWRLTVVTRVVLFILGIQPIGHHASPFLILSVHSLSIPFCYVSLRLNLYLWLNATCGMLLAFQLWVHWRTFRQTDAFVLKILFLVFINKVLVISGTRIVMPLLLKTRLIVTEISSILILNSVALFQTLFTVAL